MKPYILMHWLWEPHPNDQDQSSLQLGGGAIQPQMDYVSPQIGYEQIIYFQGTMT